MKRVLMLAIAVAAILPAIPAHSAVLTQGTHAFPVAKAIPCHVTCSYWVPHTSDPDAFVQSYNVLEDGDDRQTAFACTEPSPAGSFLDVSLTVPATADFLKIEATPTVDWDMVLCLPGNKGMIAFEDVPSLEECPAGCLTQIQVVLKPGQYSKLVLRAYNWSDPADLTAKWAFHKTKA